VLLTTAIEMLVGRLLGALLLTRVQVEGQQVVHSVVIRLQELTYSFPTVIVPFNQSQISDAAESICWRLSLADPNENSACVLFAFEQLLTSAEIAGVSAAMIALGSHTLDQMRKVRCVPNAQSTMWSMEPQLGKLHPPPTKLHFGSGKRLLHGFLNI
jgi:hypothetical protein